MSNCPTCDEPLYEMHGMAFHESTDSVLCHVAQEQYHEDLAAQREAEAEEALKAALALDEPEE